jgi:hypothetical protein
MIGFRSYIQSMLSQEPGNGHKIDRSALLLIAVLFGSYTCASLPKGFLKSFAHPLVQVVLFTVLAYACYSPRLKDRIFFAVYDGTFYMFIFQMFRWVLLRLYKEEDDDHLPSPCPKITHEEFATANIREVEVKSPKDEDD